MSRLELKNIGKQYDGGVEVIKSVDLQIADGEFVVFVGPSGCGKSTLLRMIAGLEEITRGELLIDGQIMNNTAAAKRGISMVFQSYALYPHMTVYDNMAFGLRLAGEKKYVVHDLVSKAASVLKLDSLLGRFPKELSGGQRQRVAIGRAIVRKPGVFLFDEPLSNLDASLRVQMRIELARLHRNLGATMIYVTHDQVEAMTLGDRIAVFNGGQVEQVGAPMELYSKPVNRFVATFIGSPAMNIIDCDIPADSDAMVLKGGQSIAIPPGIKVSGPAAVGIRAEDVRLGPESQYHLKATITLFEQLGDCVVAYVTLDGYEAPLTVKLPAGDLPYPPGSKVSVEFVWEKLHVFDALGRAVR